ncbi:MAG: tripartite tricarboxylate transporter substrate binding protein [Rhizobiales bacterium]|nr:tripartite tricarboxylate transporter substrate binding protein [Hyphomicrobiales bacterium]
MDHQPNVSRLRTGISRAITLAAFIGVAASASGLAHAQDQYPVRPIKLVVGFAAGGPTDILARVVGAAMSKTMGEQVFIENRTGAGGNIATEAVSRADPDGYTIQMTLMSSAINESLFKKFKVRFADSFVPIGGIAQTGLVLLAHSSLGVNNASDLIKLAKSKPGELLYASAGTGTATHLGAELFNSIAGTKMMPVHYKGGGETVKDLLSGEVKLMFSTIPPVLGFVKEGRLKGIATTRIKREAVLRNLPTIAESGLPGFDMPLWFGLAAPKGTPKPIVDKLVAELNKALKQPEVLQALAKQGFEPMIMGPEEFGKFYVTEAAKWAKVVKAVGLSR